ncbi:Kinesin light chain [Paramyrothecium foliicola]|nr:Kinesin light chain [Paramyrothecium foliicola]
MKPIRPASRLGFDIAILCALTIEADAVEALFDQYWDDDHSFGKASGDPNAYTTGSIGRHNVVLAHMPGMGKANAAVVASHCQTSYPNIKLALIVGVCGAVPIISDNNTEIILGDVIMSSGVVQYDFGRRLPEHFVRKDTLLDSLGRPNMEIRALLGKLAGRRGRKLLNEKITCHLVELQKEADLQAQYPGNSYDKLFEASFRHLSDGKTCEECQCYGQLMPRIRLEQQGIQPAVHFGLIASGDTVMKSGTERDKIARQEGIIAFEMESAGVWDTFPCIVIKGACDYADSHKTKKWQRYAAATAAACAKAFLEFWEPSATEQVMNRPAPRFIVPYPINPDFVGRSSILQQLKDKLGHAQQTHATSYSRVSLFGLGGVGKTQIALQYVYWLQEANPAISILWVHASSADRFRQSYLSIAEEYQIPGYDDPKSDLLLLVKHWLERMDCERWLMVLDNADDMQLFFGAPSVAVPSSAEQREAGNLSAYLPERRYGSLIATTRNKQLGVRLAKGQQPIEVMRMNENESAQLLRTKLDDTKAASADLSSLASRLEYLPLALAQAASFIQETCITVSKYLQLLGDSDKNMVLFLSKEFETVGRDSSAPRAVAYTWILSFQQIEKQHLLASELLSFMSLLDRQGIPTLFLSHYIEQKERDEGSLGDIELTEALGVLKAFSFITEDNSGSYDMHRLVQLVTRKWLTSNGTVSRFGKEALMVVSHLYPYGQYETRAICAAYLSHAHAILEAGEFRSRDEAEAIASLLHCMAAYFDFEGQWGDAEVLNLEAVRIRREIFGENHLSTLNSMTNLASTYRNQGRWEEAQKLVEQVIETRRKKLGAHHPSTLTSIANLALIYRNQGRWEEAEELNLQVMETRKIKLGADHPHTLSSIANLASTYRHQGRWEEAEKLDLQVIETRKIKLGADHPHTLTSMANLASTYRNRGQWEEAQKLIEQVIETRKKKLRVDHPSMLSSIANLALTYWKQSRWEEAEELNLQVIETRKIKLGADHPHTLSSIINLASMYRNQGRWEEAEKLEVQVIETCKKKLGADHPYTLTSMANLALTYRNQGRWEEAEKLNLQVMETRKTKFEADHPHTLTSMSNLASTYWHQGRWEEAEKLQIQVMEARKTKLRADHPDTLTSMGNLAFTYWSQDRYTEAVDLMSRCIKGQAVKLGVAHPAYRKNAIALAQWKCELSVTDISASS